MKHVSFLYDFFSFLYPHYCYGCGKTLMKNETCICLNCSTNLPKTDFYLREKNPLSLVFQGRTNVEIADAFLHFKKGNNIQKLIHQLKYRGNKDIGFYLGQLYGSELIENKLFNDISLIVPIPLHKKKFKKRGYNQSEAIASGMAKIMNKPLETSSFVRTSYTETQTNKVRYDRWENVSGIFSVKNAKVFKSKHILLVDDVITTGSTLESAVNTLLEISNVKVSIACLACAISN